MNSDLHDDGDDSPIQGKDLNHPNVTLMPKDTKKGRSSIVHFGNVKII